MAGYGSNGLIGGNNKNKKMFFYIGSFFVILLGLLGVLILIFALSNLNHFY